MGSNRSMTLNDIAKLAGVSRSTVSRVVNDDPRVRDSVRQRVQETIADVGYQPHAAARALASRRTGVIGLVIPEDFAAVYADPWFPPLVRACVDAAKGADLSVMLLMDSLDDKEDVDILLRRFIRARTLDGLIIANSLMGDLLTPRLGDVGVPYMLIGRSTVPGHNFVDVGNRTAARALTLHLLEHGWQRIAMINGNETQVSAIDRRAGFLDALREAGIDEASVPIIHVEFSKPGAYDVALELLSRPDRPDCIFAASDTIAIAVIEAARELGIRVPQDLGVVGFDDINSERNAVMGLTTVCQPVHQLGTTAVERLDALIHHRIEPPVEVWLETTLSLRRTCGCEGAVGLQLDEPVRKEEDVASVEA